MELEKALKRLEDRFEYGALLSLVSPADIINQTVDELEDKDKRIADLKVQLAEAQRLAVAAPDLLSELEETHAGLCLGDSDYIGSLRYKRNKAAIAKARGEEE